MTNGRNNTKITKIFTICGVLLLSTITASWTFSERPLDNHECFVSITAREMLQSSNWIWPTCNGEPRLEKTPLSYWLVAGLARITGKVDEFTSRLPSVIFGVLSVAAILYFVNQWLSFRIAVISGAVWATSLGYIRYSHDARPEMALTFFVILCFLSFYSAITAKNRSNQVTYTLVFWASFGLANLAKGPAPLPLVLIPLFFYVAIFRQWKKLFNWASVTGLIIFLAIVLPWPLAIAHKVNWDLIVWKHEFVDRFFGTYASGDKPYYYYYIPKIFQFMIPWVAFVPLALAAPFYAIWNKKQSAMQFLWFWFVVDLVFLTISAGKRQHYIMPAIPAMAILTGILLEDMVFCRKVYTNKSSRNLLSSHLVILAIIFIALPVVTWRLKHEFLYEAVLFSLTGLISLLAVAELFRAQKPYMACGVLFASITVLVMLGYTGFINPLNYNQPSRQFTLTVAEKVPPSDKLIAYKSASTRFIHYFGRRVPEIETKSEVYNLYEQGCWVVAFGNYLDELLNNDENFEVVYTQENAERHKGDIVMGALLHKSARVR
jgi:4-amino-4-deoxy-L-arabinose transferase-like glycosyltransferase